MTDWLSPGCPGEGGRVFLPAGEVEPPVPGIARRFRRVVEWRLARLPRVRGTQGSAGGGGTVDVARRATTRADEARGRRGRRVRARRSSGRAEVTERSTLLRQCPGAEPTHRAVPGR